MTNVTKQIACLLFIISTLYSCNQHGRIYREIDDAYDMIYDNVAYADYMLHQTDTTGITDEERANFYLTETKIWDYEERLHIMLDSIKIQTSYNYYLKRESAPQYAATMYYMARCLERRDSVARADVCYNKALSASIGQADYITAYRSAYGLSLLLAKIRPEAALEYARQSVGLYRRVERRGLVKAARLYVNLADKFCLCSEPDSGEVYLKCALSLTDSMTHPESKAKVYEDIASLYLNTLQQPESALRYAEMMNDSAIYLTKTQWILLAKCYEATSRNGDADYIYQLILYNPDPIYRGMRYMSYYLKTYRHDSLLGSKADSIGDVTRYYMSAMGDMKSLVSQYAEMAERNRDDANRALTDSRISRTVTIVAIISVVLLLVISLVVMLRIKRRTQMTINDAAATYRKNTQEVQQQLRNELVRRDMSIKQMQSYIYDHLSIASKLLAINDETMNMPMTAAEWTELEVYLNTTSDDFVKRLLDAHPDIDEMVLRFCMLLRLGLTNRQMAVVYGIAEKSVKQKAYTYKNKLNVVPDGVSLREYIEKL